MDRKLRIIFQQKIETLINNPLGVFKKYTKLFMKKISLKLETFRPNLFYSFNENYELHWNYTSFKGKVVLDMGADYGTTAEFFLKKGAKKVIAVEGDKYLAGSLLKRCKNSKKVIGIHKFISSKKDIEELIQEYRPDIVKIDVEGNEKYILFVNEKIIHSVKEWLIETHSKEIFDELTNFFRKQKYKVKTIDYGNIVGIKNIKVIYALK